MNGAQGVVKNIWFDQGFNAIQLLLLKVILVQFEGYSGPEIPGWQGIGPSCPIVPVVA